jgi:regulator of replication initiation timing
MSESWLQRELDRLNTEIEKSKSERDAARIEVESLRNRLRDIRDITAMKSP